jgi:Flp pilus assembly protein TadD
MYVRLFVWPMDLHFDRAQEMFTTFRNPELWVTIFVYILLGFVLWKTRRQWTKPILFFMTLFCIELFPVSQIVTTIGVRPGYISAAEHFLYMPAVGAFALLVIGTRKLYRFIFKQGLCSSQVLRLALSGIFLFLMVITASQGLNARTSITMFRRSLAYNPNNTRILYSMGIEMANRQQYSQAEHYFRQAIAGEPAHLISQIALGRSLHDQGKYIDAMTVYEAIKNAGQWNQLLEDNLNESYQRAIGQYTRWIAEQPNNAQLYYSLGTVYTRRGQTAEGIEQYKKAITLDPIYKNALFNLASSYDALGDKGWAVTYFERAVALDSKKNELDDFAYKRLGEIYQNQGDAAKAREYFEKMGVLKDGVKK